ncbi:transcriptional regulator [Geobacillus stearothermophilus]|uniref:GTP cyclohydrolase 1 type 2 homolog n=3 Tax=Geobacillus TaxID=129337 RepID=A0A2Z3NAE6_GEOTH|nr:MULTISPECIES: Nif3-like dinuclear metal center hexameric protein [Geobacillus]AWO75910.1 transcriptional regulator [Geobacillus thermoleovorans]KFL17012.1 transcriptional regulator [Geobacillus stearothermophilus]KFX35307.1 transcriptional regulator [Geobacillus stearothermophilus]KZM53172.1 transcriptional regulator [Geobacillus stearothermophilus]
MATTVQDVIERLTASVGKIPNTMDTLQHGDPNMEVKGIATSFMPTYRVIQQAVSMEANLLITHEGLFYSHTDNTDMMQKDPVHQEKIRLICESGIAIYRFHDYWHRHQPDGIMVGFIRALEWESYVSKYLPTAAIVAIPRMTAKEVAEYAKEMLSIPFVRIAGDLSAPCTRIGILVGYRGGGALSIPLFEQEHLDAIMYGEGPEWETPEYIRDAVYQGRQKALIVLGHAESEEPGMKYLAEWLGEQFPDIPVHFLRERPIFQVI